MAGEDRIYLDRVRALPCAARGVYNATTCRGGIQAHHAGARPGVAMKCHDHESHAFCVQHHTEWHGHGGTFRRWTKEQRRAWADIQIAITQARLRPAGEVML